MRKVRFLHPDVHRCDCGVELVFLLLDELIHVIKRRTLLVPEDVANVRIDRWILSIRILLTPEKLRLLQLFDALFFVTIYVDKHAILHILKGQHFLRTIRMEQHDVLGAHYRASPDQLSIVFGLEDVIVLRSLVGA